MKKYGFTLVELSIVLVIIGLLIGGILVAQSMIVTAQINGVVKDLSQYDIAITNFKQRYGKLPGDINNFPNPGDGDGMFYMGSNDEPSYFWPHLSLGVGLKTKNSQDYQPLNLATTRLAPDYCPAFNIRQNKAGTGACLVYGWGVSDSSFQNYYYYGYISGYPSFHTSSYHPLLTVDALAIDTKIDNGVGTTGNVTYMNITPTDCVVSGRYDVSNTDYSCTLYIKSNSH